MRTELGLLKRPVLPATNTADALQQFQKEIASLVFGRTHWARNFVCFFLPLDCLCSPGLYIKPKIGFGFLLLLFSFTSLLTPHRTLVNAHKINKCAKFVSILLSVSREYDENIVSHRVSIKFRPSQEQDEIEMLERKKIICNIYR